MKRDALAIPPALARGTNRIVRPKDATVLTCMRLPSESGTPTTAGIGSP